MASLPESWNAVVTSMYATKTSVNFVAGLTIHWERLKMQKAATGESTTALQANTKPQRPKLVCINPNCKRTGHSIKNCYWRGGGKEGQFPPNFHNRQSALTTIPRTTTTPTQNITSTANMVSVPTVTYALAALCNVQSTDLDQNIEKIQDTSVPPVNLYALCLESTMPMFADSRASDHCFVDREVFSTYESLKTPHKGQATFKDSVFKIVGHGTVRKTVQTSAGTTELIFNNALHTPGLMANLISIVQFDNAGFSVTFSQGWAVFKDRKGQEVLICRGKDGIYHLDVLDDQPGRQPKGMVAASLNVPVDLDGWHRRSGHAGVSIIRQLAK